MDRREFLKRSCLFALGAGLSGIALDTVSRRRCSADTVSFNKEAMYYKKIDKATVQCELCPRRCTLMDGQRSFCRVREPKAGILYSLVYGLSCATHVDPIEKKPLFHFLPGTQAFSIATAGCNFRCKYCQNWSISQFSPEDIENAPLPPADVVKGALEEGCRSIAYTYTDPAIFYEYMLDTAKIARAAGMKNLFHSNGSLNPKPVTEMAQLLDAANIDLKSFSPDFYFQVCGGYLDTVLSTLKTLKQNGVWVEVTNLVIATLNDDMKQIGQMSSWIQDNLGDETPLHFSRFWPQYKLTNLPPTQVSTLELARETAMGAGLKYVYIGNVPGHPAESTYCPKCRKVVMGRSGYSITEENIKDGNCVFCGAKIAGIWS